MISFIFFFNESRAIFRDKTFRIEMVSVALYVGEESDFFNFALPLADIGALYVRETTISTLTNNYKEFFFLFNLLPKSDSIKFFFSSISSCSLNTS